MRPRAGIFLLAGMVAGVVRGETALAPRYTGTPFVHIFEDKGAPKVQYRDIAIHPNGLVYTCASDGLYEFDGASWNLVSERAVQMNDVAIGPDGRVWYSGWDTFGYLEPDAHGVMRSHPLEHDSPDLPAALGNVVGIHIRPEGVYFGIANRATLVRVDAQRQLHVIPLPGRFFAFAHADALYVLSGEQLYRVTDDKLVPVADAPVMPPRLFDAWPRHEGGTWLLAREGLHAWHDGVITPVGGELAEFLRKEGLRCGLTLDDGTIALGTYRSGVLIVQADGHILARYGEAAGLGVNGDDVGDMALDAEGGLWVSHPPSLVRLQVRTGAAIHGSGVGLPGIVRSIEIHRGRLHAGTTLGVYSRDPATGRFNAIPGAPTRYVWALRSIEDGLLMAGSSLRLLRDDGTVEMVDNSGSEFLAVTRLRRHPDWLIVGTSRGLRAYQRREGKWTFAGPVPAIQDACFDFVEDAEGWLWSSRGRRDVFRLDWRNEVKLDAPAEFFGPALGLEAYAPRNVDQHIALVDGQVAVTSELGLHTFDPKQNRFVPESRISAKDPTARWGRAFTQDDGSIWFFEAQTHTAGTGVARPDGPGRWRWEAVPNTGLEPLTPTQVRVDPALRTIWITSRLLMSFDLQWSGARRATPRTHIRRVTAPNRAILWGGAGHAPALELSPDQNALQFDYAATSFHTDMWGRMQTEYRTRLEGFDADWSEWTSDTKRAYTNLPPGSFSFQVQARDIPGRIGETSAFAFSVATPWWRTPLALALAVPLAAGLVLLFVRLRTRALRRHAEALEAQIAARTAELAGKNTELSRLHRLELSEKNAARVAEDKAQLELLRYQLNPHFLFNALNSIYGQVYPHSRAAGELVRRLAEFCRSTFAHRGDQWHTCAEEFAMLRTYLDIEQARWRDRLVITFTPDPALEAARIPAFLLLPFAENAVKHGGATSPDILCIRVASRVLAGGAMEITLANTGRWLTDPAAAAVPSHGLGMENVRTRLQKIFPDRHRLDVTTTDGWVVITLELPVT